MYVWVVLLFREGISVTCEDVSCCWNASGLATSNPSSSVEGTENLSSSAYKVFSSKQNPPVHWEVGGRRKRHSYKMLIVQLVVLAEDVLVLC